MSRSRSAVPRTCTWSAGRHVAQLVAPGRRLSERAQVALGLPARIRADLQQARRIAAGADRRTADTRVWLVCDKRPDPTVDSSSLRLAWIVLIALRRGWDVRLYSLRERRWLSPRIGDGGPTSLWLEPTVDNGGGAAVAWIVEPDAACVAMAMLASTGRTRIVYDTVDLHHRRFSREAEATGSRGRRAQAFVVRALERRAVRTADLTIAISDEELPLVKRLGARRVRVVPNIHEPRHDESPPKDSRSGVFFMGNFAHAPNVDAVEVLVREVMPRLWTTYPELELLVAGQSFPAHVFPALDARVRILGWVQDIDAALDASLVLVAPLRFGAGLKGKVGYAMARGTPVVTTTVGAEGFPDNGTLAVCEAGDWDAFAARVSELFEDADLWVSRSRGGIATVRERFSPQVVEPVIASVLESA
jgi:glycosyltransferase involved in cell wall biosynthesis